MNRSDAALQPVSDAHEISGLPRASSQGTFYREHQERPGEDGGCWWFSGTAAGASPEGRFDLPTPRGSLYLAETARVASRERCGRFLAHRSPIPVTFVEGRVISTVDGALRDLADLTHDDAADVGTTREIGTLDDYVVTCTWAVAASLEGFTGLRYFPRFTTGNGKAFAVFGDAGAHVPAGFSITSVAPLASVLAHEGVPPRMIPSSWEAVDDGEDVVDVG
ncbi:RES domain-containing protein [Brachybacterium tyrofermentans]|uniref:RES domain-containing protein n=1 Tax=Brachybacterium tyrofermentans TaxID=47848 RepID=UPI003FD56A48